eukprot:SAG31_NODE_45274_length_259_cov_0.968750_2_plen_40_part_01
MAVVGRNSKAYEHELELNSRRVSLGEVPSMWSAVWGEVII